MGLSSLQMDQEGAPNPNVSPSSYPTKYWGLFGEVAHTAQQNFVIGQFANTESFHW